jgi:hypothetical protein
LDKVQDGYGVIDGGSFEGQEDSKPLRVEPLAIVIPPSLGHFGNAEAKGSGRKPSNWVQRKEKGVGKLLGASYSGYEQAVTKLLMDIEARHLQRKAGMIGP